MTDSVKKLQRIIDESNDIVFFGGAGVSTESGLKDFRSTDGLYNEKYLYPPEQILSSSFFYASTDEFYKFYFDKLLIDGIEPNSAHYKVAELERAKKLKAVVTQNVDGLHSKAGSKNVYELHGSCNRNYCLGCGAQYSFLDMLDFKKKGKVPKCSCGAVIKPDVVLYGENLRDDVVFGAINAIGKADTLIVAGTSLTVYPASSFINYFNGKSLVIINKDGTSADGMATLVIHDKVGETLAKIDV